MATIHALKAELLKSKAANIRWTTFIAFSLAPIMGAVFMLIMRNPEALETAGALRIKSEAMNFSANWNSYFQILTQAVGVGGVLIFGFVASWIFGREYSEGTAKDLMALPTSRTTIVNAKFIIYGGWCLALAISNLLIGLILGSLLQIGGFETLSVSSHMVAYLATTILTILLGTPIAFFAFWGRGYLAPLGFVALTLVFAQIIAATGYGFYFPWSVPGLYSGAGGAYKMQLNNISYIILIVTSIAGYVTTVTYFNHSDQNA